MKIQTHDGSIFDVPEQVVERFLTEYNAKTGYNTSAQEQSDTPVQEQTNVRTDDVSDTEQKRGDNWAGGARNFVAGLIPFADEFEALVRSGGGKDYDKYLRNARESRAGFSQENPEAAIGLQIAGGVLPALATGGLGAAGAATKLGKVALGGLSGAATGAVYGFGEGEGGFENRLRNAQEGMALGGAVGAIAPSVAGAAGRVGSRILRGMSKNSLPESQVAEAILKYATKPGEEGKQFAAQLARASEKSARDITRAAENLNQKLNVIKAFNENPELADTAILAPTWTSQTPSAKKIVEALRPENTKMAEKTYADYIKNVKPAINPGLMITNLAKKEPMLGKFINADLTKNARDWENIRLTSLEGINRLIDRAEKESLSPQPFGASKKTYASINQNAWARIKKDLLDIRDRAYPEARQINAIYRGGKTLENAGVSTGEKRLAQINKAFAEHDPELSATGLSKIAYSPYVRGKAREMISNAGKLKKDTPWQFEKKRAVADSIARAIKAQGDLDYGNIGVAFENGGDSSWATEPRYTLEELEKLLTK